MVVHRKSERGVKANPWTQWKPPVITAAGSPINPGRSPFVARNPGPAVEVAKKPPAIVEGSPSPIVMRYPGVAIGRHDPVSVGAVGLKASFGIGNPYESVMRIFYPISIRTKLFIENLKGHGKWGSLTCFGSGKQKQQHSHDDKPYNLPW
jgi:hypothetical protein